LSRGCHRLIREGAKLAGSVSDTMQEIAPLAGKLARGLKADDAAVPPARLEVDGPGPNLGGDPEYRRLWSCLAYDPLPMDALIDASGLTAKAVSAMLLMLELRGRVEAHPGGAFSRTRRSSDCSNSV